jgi:hypothetical protein
MGPLDLLASGLLCAVSWLVRLLLPDSGPKALGLVMMDRLRQLLGPRVEEGTKPESRYQLPVFQRRDGATIKLGYLVKHTAGGTDSYVVKQILVRADSGHTRLVLGRLAEGGVTEEEVECGVGEVSSVRGREAVPGLARDGMAAIARSIAAYPMGVQRRVRRHQLAAALRRDVQRFLGGFGHTHAGSLGAVDWRLDPGILGLERHTDFSLDYRIEQFVAQTSHMDLLLGRGWDVR